MFTEKTPYTPPEMEEYFLSPKLGILAVSSVESTTDGYDVDDDLENLF